MVERTVTLTLPLDEAIMLKSVLAQHYEHGSPGVRPRLYAEREAFAALYRQLMLVKFEGDVWHEARQRLDAKWQCEHPSQESDWSGVEGAEELRRRLGWWPTFHDAQLLWAKYESRKGRMVLGLRFELDEGGPKDRFTMFWEDVDVFDVDGWDHGTGGIYFSDSLLKGHGNTWHFSLTGGQGNWTIVGGPISVVDVEEEPEGSWPEEGV